MGRSIANAVVAAALCIAAPLAAHAAGLGKLTVLSALGQPLNAEIEIVALQPGEDDSLTARLASPEAFRQAGIDFNGALLGLRFSVIKRDNRAFLRLNTTQPVNEPFLEMLVELQWNTGRLVREYTFLLDPAEYKGPAAIAAAPAAKAPEEAPKAEAPKTEEPKPEAKPEEPKAETAKVEEPKPAAEAKPEEAQPQEPKPEEPKAETQPGQAPLEARPIEAAPTEPKAAAEPKPAEPTVYEVKKGDTLGAIAKQYLAPGVTLDQMLIAIYRANQDAFIRDNINLVRAGRILTIPPAEGAGSLDPDDAKRLVRSHHADFNAYRARLAAAPAPAEATPGQRESTGRIEPKPAPTPPEKQDQLRLSRADPQKPASAANRAAQGDDQASRQRALSEAQSRVTDLEKNVADLQKMLEIRSTQLAELEKRAKPAAVPPPPATAKPTPEAAKPAPEAAKPAPAPAPAANAPEKPAAQAPKPAADAPKPVPAPAPTTIAKAPEKPAAEAPKPAAEAPKPAAEAPKPAAEAPKPAAEAPKPAAETPKPSAVAPKKAEAPKPAAKKAAPEPSVIDEFLDNPTALASLGGVVLLLVGYGAWAWRRKKRSQAKFQDSVLDAASGAGAASVFGTPSGAPSGGAAGASQTSASQAPAGMEAEEVDPIAEADVYMAYGRDAQAEEILKEALAKDANRTAVHAKLLEIYANRKDTKSFEQSALKLKSLTNGAGPAWDKAVALGRSIDPQNGLYGGSGAAPAPVAAAAAAAAPAAAAPTLDFDLGGATTPGSTDISLDAPAPKDGGSVDFDLGAAASMTTPGTPASDFTPEGTLIMDQKADPTGGLDFDLGLGGGSKPAAPAASAPAADATGGLDFDLNLDSGDKSADKATQPAPSMDLSAISLDLGETTPGGSGGGGGDPKWQEVATKLDLAKAYEEMGDKDGARELLNEVMKDGDAAQKGQAQQLLAKIG
ncbi:MAG TPA: FimV/HubP family polar landmark protein [Burkholderiales bacterium]|nr:FimV/HubP family polar landmark protein [Burkholderiales bacterium]